MALRYSLVRVWRHPPAQWLTGGLGLMPLAPLGDVSTEELPTVIAQMKERLARDATPQVAAELWSATYILMGLRYEQPLIQTLLQGVIAMKESVTYQAILEEGWAKGEAEGRAKGETQEARKILLLQGRNRFGEPSAEVVAALNALTDIHQLEALSVRLLHASSWQELLGRNGSSSLAANGA